MTDRKMEAAGTPRPLQGTVHSLETFGLVDGPGVRTVIFLQGCRMRCAYCHNPETWKPGEGESWTPEELFGKVYRYKNYWKDNGGITVSGGEPLLQVEFVARLFELAKAKGVHTTLDTAGNPFTTAEPFFGTFKRLMAVTDLVMLDIKEMDEGRHKELTGCDNGNILAMARYLSDQGKDLWIRHVLVSGHTDREEDLIRLRDFARELKTLRRLEVLPYHTLGKFKWTDLGLPYRLEGVPAPTEEEVARAERLLETERYR